MELTKLQKERVCKIKDALKSVPFRSYFKVKPFQNGIYVNLHFSEKEDNGSDFGFSYDLNTEEDLQIILNSI